MNKLAIALATTALLAAGLTGCEKKIDDAKLETKIKEFLANKGVTASAVQCPADIKEEKGKTFDCTATVDDKTLTVTVEMQGEGAVSWQVTDFGGLTPDVAPEPPSVGGAEPATGGAEPATGEGEPAAGDGEAAVDDM